MKTILLALLMTISMVASANNCPAINDSLTVCDVATQNADSMSEVLPMQAADGVTITGAEAIDNQIRLTVNLEFTEEDMLILIIDSSATPNEVKAGMKASTKSLICSSEELRIFIKAGGEIAYTYNLKDGSRFHYFVIDEC